MATGEEKLMRVTNGEKTSDLFMAMKEYGMKRKKIIVVEAAEAAEPVEKKTVVRKLSVINEQQ